MPKIEIMPEEKIRAIMVDGNLYWMPRGDIEMLQDIYDQVDKLAKYILEYFPGNIINEGACLTAIGIMEALRNK